MVKGSYGSSARPPVACSTLPHDRAHTPQQQSKRAKPCRVVDSRPDDEQGLLQTRWTEPVEGQARL